MPVTGVPQYPRKNIRAHPAAVEIQLMIAERAIEIGLGTANHSSPNSPSYVTVNNASPSGRLGESTNFATRLSPFDFRKYIRNVEVCPRICPPIGFVGSPKNASGFDIT